jgi:glycosyltransferase involved in cell wall biosynthesis
MTSKTAAARLEATKAISSTFPVIRPWTACALWHGLVELPVPTTSLDDEIDVVIEQRLAPLLLRYVVANNVEISDNSLTRLRKNDFVWSTWTHALVSRADEALSLLKSAGIEFAISKGPGIAAHYEPGARPFADLDVLVRPRDFRAAQTLLAASGYVEDEATVQPWSSFDRWCREGINLKSARGGSIDLHHHVPPWYWGQELTVARLLKQRREVSFRGFELPCLNREANLLIAAMHVVSDHNEPGRTLLIWRDIAQLAGECDAAAARDTARSAALEGWLRAVLVALPEAARPTEVLRLLSDDAVVTKGPRRLTLLLSISGRYGVRFTQPLRLPIPLALLFEVGMAVPSRSFLRKRYPGARWAYLRWWRGRDREMHPTKPRVVYWTNQPSPYTVGRLNAVHDLGVVELSAWFDEVRQPDRSWDVDPSSWRFDYRWVPKVKGRGRELSLPIDLLTATRPDLVVQLFDTPATAIGALVSRAYARRVSFRVLPAYAAWGQETAFTRFVKQFLFRLADAAKVPGDDGIRRATRYGLTADRCFRVTQTIDVEHYRGDEETRRRGAVLRSDLGLNTTTFIYVGRLWQGKGLDYLLEAFRQLAEERSDVSLLVVGDGVDDSRYRKLAAECSDIHVTGFVQPADLPAYYAASNVLVFPTLGDPHGLVVEEAMAAGLAIISSDAAGDICSRVEERRAGRVVARASVSALLTAMRDFADDPHGIAETGLRNAREVAALTHDAYARDFAAFVDQVMRLPARATLSSRVGSVFGRALGVIAARSDFSS